MHEHDGVMSVFARRRGRESVHISCLGCRHHSLKGYTGHMLGLVGNHHAVIPDKKLCITILDTRLHERNIHNSMQRIPG